MRSHISVHRATTKYFSNMFVFKKGLKRKDFQGIARLAWAQEVPSSNLGAPTTYFFVFNSLCPMLFAHGIEHRCNGLSGVQVRSRRYDGR